MVVGIADVCVMANVCGIADVCGISDVCGIAYVCRIAFMGNIGGIIGGNTSSKHAKYHSKISKIWCPEPPKSKPGASKIGPGGLQGAILKIHLT